MDLLESLRHPSIGACFQKEAPAWHSFFLSYTFSPIGARVQKGRGLRDGGIPHRSPVSIVGRTHLAYAAHHTVTPWFWVWGALSMGLSPGSSGMWRLDRSPNIRHPFKPHETYAPASRKLIPSGG